MPSTADRLTLRPAEERDIAAILALNRRFYAGEPWVTDKFFRWRFGDTPAGRPVVFVAFDGDVLAGSFSVFPLRFLVHGQPVLAGAAWAVLMSPDYATVILRRDGKLKSIFIALADLALDECRRRGMAFVYCFPNKASIDGFVKHLGFTQPDTLRFRVCPLRFAPLLRQKLPRLAPLAPLLAGPARLVFRTLHPRRRPGRDVRVRPATFDSPVLAEVWERCRAGWPLLHVRDAAYYRWRFTTNPFARYELLLAHYEDFDERGGRIDGPPAGMLVYSRQTFQDRQRGTATEAGAIVDWLVANDQHGPGVLHALLHHAAEALRRTGVSAVIAADNLDEPWRAAFNRGGFQTFVGDAVPKQFPLTVRVFDEPPFAAQLRDPARWLLNFADNDVV
jgi:hypothetical protein